MVERLKNIVYDTNYTTIIPNGGFVTIPENQPAKEKKKKWLSWMDNLLKKLWLAPQPTKKEEQEDKKNKEIPEDKEKEVEKKNPKLAEQVREILQMPDEEYSDKKLTSELRQYIKEVDDRYN